MDVFYSAHDTAARFMQYYCTLELCLTLTKHGGKNCSTFLKELLKFLVVYLSTRESAHNIYF